MKIHVWSDHCTKNPVTEHHQGLMYKTQQHARSVNAALQTLWQRCTPLITATNVSPRLLV